MNYTVFIVANNDIAEYVEGNEITILKQLSRMVLTFDAMYIVPNFTTGDIDTPDAGFYLKDDVDVIVTSDSPIFGPQTHRRITQAIIDDENLPKPVDEELTLVGAIEYIPTTLPLQVTSDKTAMLTEIIQDLTVNLTTIAAPTVSLTEQDGTDSPDADIDIIHAVTDRASLTLNDSEGDVGFTYSILPHVDGIILSNFVSGDFIEPNTEVFINHSLLDDSTTYTLTLAPTVSPANRERYRMRNFDQIDITLNII